MSWQPGKTLAQMEREHIYDALKFYQNNKVHTANALGISARTLYNKLEEYERELKQNERREESISTNPNFDKWKKEQEGKANGDKANAGSNVESVVKTTAEHAVPLRKSEKVQKVSSAKAITNDTKRNG